MGPRYDGERNTLRSLSRIASFGGRRRAARNELRRTASTNNAAAAVGRDELRRTASVNETVVDRALRMGHKVLWRHLAGALVTAFTAGEKESVTAEWQPAAYQSSAKGRAEKALDRAHAIDSIQPPPKGQKVQYVRRLSMQPGKEMQFGDPFAQEVEVEAQVQPAESLHEEEEMKEEDENKPTVSTEMSGQVWQPLTVPVNNAARVAVAEVDRNPLPVATI